MSRHRTQKPVVLSTNCRPKRKGKAPIALHIHTMILQSLRLPLSGRLLPSNWTRLRLFPSPLRMVIPQQHHFFSQISPLLQKKDTQMKQRIENVREKSQKVTNQVRSNIKYAIPEKENIYTIPNILTFTRLITAPMIGYLIVQQQVWWAFGLFTYSAITDFVDGFIARRFNMKSVVGSIIDPMADKFLMIICTACMAQSGGMPLYLAVIILGRDIGLAISALYYRYISLPAPKTLLRFWDFSIPSAQVYPTTISKYNTGFQMLYIAGAVVKPVLLQVIDPSFIGTVDVGFEWFGYFVATTTVISGLSYVFSKNAVKILTPPSQK